MTVRNLPISKAPPSKHRVLGDNSSMGRQNRRRLQAGTYPLTTYAGAKYATIAYATNPLPSALRRPAIGLGSTGQRVGAAILPGAGFPAAFGAIILSKPLSGPEAQIEYQDSRGRVIALIDAMQKKLGSDFPSKNGIRIPNAWIVVAGEPPISTVATPAEEGPDDTSADDEDGPDNLPSVEGSEALPQASVP